MEYGALEYGISFTASYIHNMCQLYQITTQITIKLIIIITKQYKGANKDKDSC